MWAEFKDQVYLPKKMSITCLIDYEAISIIDSNSFNLQNSPLEELQLITWIKWNTYTFSQFGCVSIMENLINSNTFPRLKTISLEIQVHVEQFFKNTYYKADINGVVLKVNTIFVTQHSVDRYNISNP